MRLIHFINEDIKLDKIKKQCKYYIDLVKNNNCSNKFFYKGMNKQHDFDIIKTRKNRKPLNMPLKLHNYIDKLFKKKFGVKLRSETIFVTSDIIWSGGYGFPSIIIPIGKFDYYWNQHIDDLYEDFPFFTSNNNIEKNLDKYKKEIIKIVDGYNKNKNFKVMKDVFDGEVMIDCKSYYATTSQDSEYLNQLFE
jgi:hypothetical protein